MLTFFRVYSGTLSTGQTVLNATRDRKERIGRIVRMHANTREDVERGLRRRHRRHRRPERYAHRAIRSATIRTPILLESISFPEPVISIAIEPKTKADQDKLSTALVKLASEDPTFRVSTDPETAQTILAGMGELHLDIKVDILKRTYGVEANFGAPQVAYRESIHQKAVARVPFKRQTGGSGQYGDCELEVEPLEPGTGLRVRQQTDGRLDPEGVHSRH